MCSRKKMTAFWICVWRLVWWRGTKKPGEPLSCRVNGSDLKRLCLSETKSVNLQLDTCHPYCKTHKKIHHMQINTILFNSQTAHSVFLFFSATKTSTRNIFYLLHSHKVWQRSQATEKEMRRTIETKTEKHLACIPYSPEEYYWNNVELASVHSGQSSTLQVVEDAQQNGCVWD